MAPHTICSSIQKLRKRRCYLVYILWCSIQALVPDTASFNTSASTAGLLLAMEALLLVVQDSRLYMCKSLAACLGRRFGSCQKRNIVKLHEGVNLLDLGTICTRADSISSSIRAKLCCIVGNLEKDYGPSTPCRYGGMGSISLLSTAL